MDTYRTLSAPASARYTVKMSRFLAFAYPVASEEEAKALIRKVANNYHDARHVCWAYMLGHDRSRYQSSDNGEPSGTAGKPILGQINSFSLTNIIIVVVRYFGGIKLGTPGLIAAYREAARLAIEAGEIIECHRREMLRIHFPYLAMNDVMKIVKGSEIQVLDQQFDNTCSMTLSMRADDFSSLSSRLLALDGVTAD